MSERLQGLPPIVSRQTRLIVLGSFPGVASLQARQYYAHPRNQFWPILAALWGVDFSGASYPRRIAEIRRRGLGLWDVHASCERVGSLCRPPAPPTRAGVLIASSAPGVPFLNPRG